MIADKLGVGEEMARQMLHELARFGYVEKFDFFCSTNKCRNCASYCNSANFPGNRSTLWILTKKGKKVAGKI